MYFQNQPQLNPAVTDNVTNFVGYYDGEDDTESVLDQQYVTAMGVGANNWYWTTPGWLYEFASHFVNTTNIPQVDIQLPETSSY